MSTKRILEISTLKAIIIKSLFEVIKPYIKETNILINNEGLKISTMDTSKVSLTYIKLKSEKFEKYYCEKHLPTLNHLNFNLISNLRDF